MINTHDKVRLPSLRAVAALEASARLGSFTAAARELAVTQGAISRQIQELEQLLGQALFIRSGPSLKLTATGANFAQSAALAIETLREAVVRAQSQQQENHVTLSMLPSVATKWLAPRLGRFIAASPEIDLRIAATRNLVNFSAEGVDGGIRYGRGRWQGLESELLGQETISPVCTPALAATLNLVTPGDLSRATLFHTDIEEKWADWFKKAGYDDLQVPRGPMLGDDAATLQAVVDGQGIALGRSVLVADDIAAGRLIYPFETQLEASFSYWFVTPSGKQPSADLLAVKGWVKAEFEKDQTAFLKAPSDPFRG